MPRVLSLYLIKSESGDEMVEPSAAAVAAHAAARAEAREKRRTPPPPPRAEQQFRVSMFTKTAMGKTVCLRVPDFRPFFHVVLALPLTDERMRLFMTWLRRAVCPQQQQQQQQQGGKDMRMTATVERHFVEETYSGGEKVRALRLEFSTERMLSAAVRFLRSNVAPPALQPPRARPSSSNSPAKKRRGEWGQAREEPPPPQQGEEEEEEVREIGARVDRAARGYETYGGKMPSLHNFYHKCGLSASGWMKIRFEDDDEDKDEDDDAKAVRCVSDAEQRWSDMCDVEYVTRCASLRGDPTRVDPVPISIASVDLETSSSHGDFPVPIKDYSKPATQIVDLCGAHVHGVSAETAARFMDLALKHLFPTAAAAAAREEAAAEAEEEEEEEEEEEAAEGAAAEQLPLDRVFPKAAAASSSSTEAVGSAAWRASMLALFAEPVSSLVKRSQPRMHEFALALRVAGEYERKRLALEREAQASAEADTGADVGTIELDKLAIDAGEGGAGGARKKVSVPAAPSARPEDEDGEVEGAADIVDWMTQAGMPVHRTSFLDVLRARVGNNGGGKQLDDDDDAQQRRERQQFFFGGARDKKKGEGGEGGGEKTISRAHKVGLLNRLMMMCLPPIEGDRITFVGTVFSTENPAGGGPAQESAFVHAQGAFAAVPGVTAYSAADHCDMTDDAERAMLLAWRDTMRQRPVDVMLTYNGFGFDNQFMFLRAKELGVDAEVFAFSRRRGHSGLALDWRTKRSELLINETSLASGTYSMQRPSLPGIGQIDLMFYFRREHTSYTAYGLDAVAAVNLSDAVKAADVVERETGEIGGGGGGEGEIGGGGGGGEGNKMLRLETQNLTGLVVGDFVCLQLMDGKLATNYLSQRAPAMFRGEELPPLHGDGRLKVCVRAIERTPEGRNFLLLDGEVDDWLRAQLAAERAEAARLLGEPPEAAAAAPMVQLRWCLAKDDVPYKEMFKLARGSRADRARVAKYCVGDCRLPLVLARKLGVVAWYLETAALCSVDMDVLVFRGQGVKLASYVGKACRDAHTLLRDLDNEPVCFDAALVLEPRIQPYGPEPLNVNDFSSLYPSLMAGYNFSPGTRIFAVLFRLGPGADAAFCDGGALGAPFAYEGVLKSESELDNLRAGETPFAFHGLPGHEYVYTWYALKKRVPGKTKQAKEKQVVVGSKLVCWLAPRFDCATHTAASHPARAGIYPQQALGLLSARRAKKKLQAATDEPFRKAVYKLQELVVKTSNNSVYGQLGSATSPLRDVDVAASICTAGRMHITYTKTLVERLYADRVVRVAPYGAMRTRSAYVYGDTDSVFFVFNLETVDPRAFPDAYRPKTTSTSSSSSSFAPQPVRGEVALQVAVVLSEHVAQMVTDTGPDPMALAYEKTFMSFVIVSKKKYAGIKFERAGKMLVCKGLSFMGLQVKRRDSCDCVRDVFGTILDMLLRDAADVAPMVRYLNAVVGSIVAGEVPAAKFTMTKTLKAGYADPLQVAHNVLADRIEARAPGTRPKPGDRVTYAKVVPLPGAVGSGAGGALIGGDRIDTLEQIQTQLLLVDYEEYVRTDIMSPVTQLLSLVVDRIVAAYGCARVRADWADAARDLEPLRARDLPAFNKCNKKLAARFVQQLIFEPFLAQLRDRETDRNNRAKGQTSIRDAFASPKLLLHMQVIDHLAAASARVITHIPKPRQAARVPQKRDMRSFFAPR